MKYFTVALYMKIFYYKYVFCDIFGIYFGVLLKLKNWLRYFLKINTITYNHHRHHSLPPPATTPSVFPFPLPPFLFPFSHPTAPPSPHVMVETNSSPLVTTKRRKLVTARLKPKSCKLLVKIRLRLDQGR